MKINFCCDISIDIDKPNLKNIIESFLKIQRIILPRFINSILLSFAEHYMKLEKKPFVCGKCGNAHNFVWKTKKGKQTKLLTIFGIVLLNQMQVKCKNCGHKKYITRQLLEIAPRKRIPAQTVRKLGMIGALSSFRVAQKIVRMFGWNLNQMTVWRSLQKLAKEIEFDLDMNESAHGEADGTGIPIQGIKKRGKELKVFVQLKKGGGVRIAGLSIGNYDSQWEKLFNPLIPKLKKFKDFLLVTDGDASILKPLEGKVKIIYQRCLWHIPHQFKWYLWKDKVKRKSNEWIYAITKLINISITKNISYEDEKVIEKLIDDKEKELKKLIEYCELKGWDKSKRYLENAYPNMFNSLKNRLAGRTSSRVERVMRTVNMRANIGKWSTTGVLNAIKVRLAYYYNDFDVE